MSILSDKFKVFDNVLRIFKDLNAVIHQVFIVGRDSGFVFAYSIHVCRHFIEVLKGLFSVRRDCVSVSVYGRCVLRCCIDVVLRFTRLVEIASVFVYISDALLVIAF